MNSIIGTCFVKGCLLKIMLNLLNLKDVILTVCLILLRAVVEGFRVNSIIGTCSVKGCLL